MKRILIAKLLALAVFTVVLTASSFAADKPELKETKFKTSAYSFFCKNEIETSVKKLDGVEEAYLELSDKILTVKYNPEKVNPEKIKKTVTELGYEAEVMKENAGNGLTGLKK
jgi:periplasmic mercuric ion binding protein